MDETKKDVTPYFGIGTAMFVDDHSRQLWEGTELRIQLEREGVRLPQGLHAVNDRKSTRHRVIDLMLDQGPTLDSTLLKKENAYASVRRNIEKEPTVLYSYAWRFHFDFLMHYKIPKQADVVVIAGTLGTKREAKLARRALEDMCARHRGNREITLCIWDAPTSWGLQVADYAAWSAYRAATGVDCQYYKRLSPLVRSIYRPWTKDGEDPWQLTPDAPHGPLPDDTTQASAGSEEEKAPASPPDWVKPVPPPAWVKPTKPAPLSSWKSDDSVDWGQPKKNQNEPPPWWPGPHVKPPF